jgi:hypothetical protein
MVKDITTHHLQISTCNLDLLHLHHDQVNTIKNWT